MVIIIIIIINSSDLKMEWEEINKCYNVGMFITWNNKKVRVIEQSKFVCFTNSLASGVAQYLLRLGWSTNHTNANTMLSK